MKRAATVAAVLTAVLGAATPAWASRTVPYTGALWGAAAGQTTFDALEQSVGHPLNVDRKYAHFGDNLAAKTAQDRRADGSEVRTPLLSVKPNDACLNTGTCWRDVASGKYDAEITREAKQLQPLGPVILVFHHEANATSGAYGGAADYVAAFQHYVDVFRSVGTPDVKFSTTLTNGSYVNNDQDQWYPTDAYVDFVGDDAYNFAGCQSSGVTTSKYIDLSTLAQSFVAFARRHGKRMLFPEFGTEEYTTAGNPTLSAKWISNAAAWIKANTDIKGASYFDEPGPGACDYTLTRNQNTVNAYVNAANDPYFSKSPPF